MERKGYMERGEKNITPSKSVTNSETTVQPDVREDISIGNQSDMEITTETDSIPQEHSAGHHAPWWLDVVVVILLFFASQFVGSFICMLIGITPPDSALFTSEDIDTQIEASSAQAKFIACTTIFAMILCLGFMAFYSRRRGWEKPLSFRTPGWASPFRLLCGYMLLWIFTIAIEPVADKLPGSQDVLGSGGWLLISAVFLAPIFEEIIFRGYIGGTLRKAYGATAAWIISSLLFGIVHGIPSVILPATLSGLVLGFYYIRYRSLILVITLHAMNNITACFLSSLGLEDASLRDMIGDDRIYWVIYALCLSIFIIAIARMWQIVRELTKDKYIS